MSASQLRMFLGKRKCGVTTTICLTHSCIPHTSTLLAIYTQQLHYLAAPRQRSSMSGKGRDPFDDDIAQPRGAPASSAQDDPFGDAAGYGDMDGRGQEYAGQRGQGEGSRQGGYALDPFFDE